MELKPFTMSNSRFQYLSYFLNEDTIIYGGNKGIEIKKLSDIEMGDTANTKSITLHNHSGTHIDFPNHFIINGKVSSDYDPNFWIFTNPFIVDVNLKKDQNIIDSKSFKLESIPKKTDFLILNTGFFNKRGTKVFWNNNPGISSNLAKQLKNQCPMLRVLGMDTISLSGYQNRDLGRESHKEFLGKYDILLVEDMDLRNINNMSPKKIMCFPLLIEKLDGCPVTIIAEY